MNTIIPPASFVVGDEVRVSNLAKYAEFWQGRLFVAGVAFNLHNRSWNISVVREHELDGSSGATDGFEVHELVLVRRNEVIQ